MAIVIEESRKKINWFAWALVSAVVATIIIAIYYLFFSPVPLIEKVIPEQLKVIESISSNPFDPSSVINDPTYKILRQYINPLQVSSSTPQRPNPFSR